MKSIRTILLLSVLMSVLILAGACSPVPQQSFPQGATSQAEKQATLEAMETRPKAAPAEGLPDSSAQHITIGETFPVDALFTEFYAFFEGVQSLGPAISPPFVEGVLQKQYVEAGLMVFDPLSPAGDRFRLEVLGYSFGVEQAAVPDLHLPGARYVNGHHIYGKFLDLYDRLGGAQFIGKPLTEAYHNLAKGRIEQYFENLGFFRFDHDESETVYLIAYGAYACTQRCRYQTAVSRAPGSEGILPEPFAAKANSLGLPFLGLMLSDVLWAEDGKQEVIFENLVLMADSSPEGVSPRPIVTMLDITPQPLVAPGNDPLMVFYPLQEGQGHHVPLYFDQYLARYGGPKLSGVPLTEVHVTEQGKYRQCFENLCLEFDPNVPEGENLRPAALGALYKARFYGLDEGFLESQSLAHVTLKVWERDNLVSSVQEQEIRVMITKNGAPLKDREPTLILSVPGDDWLELTFPPTDQNGRSSVRIPPIPAPNGTIIPYQVCLKAISGEVLCEGENYFIWNQP